MSGAMVARDGVFLSVRPRFSRALLNGTKRIEFRRRSFRAKAGTIIAVYEASPTRALTGFLIVEATYEATLEGVWTRWGSVAALSRWEYDNYFAGCLNAFAIHIAHALPLPDPLSLDRLRWHVPGFMPPRSFRYLESLPSSLLGMVERALRSALARVGHLRI
jgi:predicted transcriptional regulator